jgi:hypothetical protein
VLLLALAGAAVTLLRWRSALPAASAPAAPEGVAAWWENPPPLTGPEVAFQRWLAAITCDLPRERWPEHWNVGGGQYGVFSIRYQAAFAGYAAAALGMRTPAYPALTRRILESAVDHLVDRSAWRYIGSYWKDQPWYPDPCGRENIMYSGHLLQLMALHEALSGDSRYRTTGVDLVWDDRSSFHYTTLSLAAVTVRQMRENASGGVACEPSLIFFPCNNHPHIALRLLEGMGLGDWTAERRKWESWALQSYAANLGGGAFKLFYHQKSGMFVPRGHPGLDGWSLLWYAPWAANPGTPRRTWQSARAHLDLDQFPLSATTAEASAADQLGATCCNPVRVPLSSVASFLAPAARACGDAETAARLEAWLDAGFRRTENGQTWLATNPEWQIGVTANRALSAALENGSDLRALVQRPLPRDWFAGPLIARVEPPEATVYAARRVDDTLIVDVDGGGQTVTVELANVVRINAVVGIPAEHCRLDGPRLILDCCPRVSLRVVVEAARPAWATPLSTGHLPPAGTPPAAIPNSP